MDWSNEPYVKVYTRVTDDDLALSWEARAVWDALMKRFDRSGMFETKRGSRGIAAAVHVPIDVVDRVLPELLADGRLVQVEAGFCAPNYIAAQEAKKSDKLRQKEVRDRRRAQNLEGTVTKRDADATFRDETSRAVTPRHTESLSALLCSADPDPERCSAVTLPPEPPALGGDEDLARRARQDLRTEIWRQLTELRQAIAAELGAEARPLHPQDPGERALSMRILEGATRADCEHVLAVVAAEARAKRSFQFLTGAIFEERPWRRALGMSESDATGSASTRGPHGDRPPEPRRPIRTL